MKDCVNMYDYKGFTIRFSETYQEWSAEPNFLFDIFEDENSKTSNFVGDHMEDIEPQKTIAKMKKAINESVKEGLKDKLIEEFKKANSI